MAVDDAYTKSLLHFDGNLTDEAGNTWTATGGATISSAWSKFGGSSLYIPAGGALYIAMPSWYSGATNLTVDFWLKWISGRSILDANYANSDSTALFFEYRTDLSGFQTALKDRYNDSYGTGNFPNIWDGNGHHVALTYDGSITKTATDGTFYVGGRNGSVSISGSYLSIGVAGGTPASFYIDEFRISNTVRWSSNFTPPTAPYGGTICRCQLIGSF